MAEDKTQKNTKSQTQSNSSQSDNSNSSGGAQDNNKDERGQPFDMAQVKAVLQVLRVTKKPLSIAPSNSPKNFADQIQYYDSGGVRRLYIYISGTWRYVTLT